MVQDILNMQEPWLIVCIGPFVVIGVTALVWDVINRRIKK